MLVHEGCAVRRGGRDVGQASTIYNVHPDGSVSLNTPQNSLDPDKDVGLTIFLTGLGGLDFGDRKDGTQHTAVTAQYRSLRATARIPTLAISPASARDAFLCPKAMWKSSSPRPLRLTRSIASMCPDWVGESTPPGNTFGIFED